MESRPTYVGQVSIPAEFLLQQIDVLQQELTAFERKYGMRFEQFAQYLHERSVLLGQADLAPEHRQTLGRAVMQEEDDWLDWKAAREMLESWQGLCLGKGTEVGER